MKIDKEVIMQEEKEHVSEETKDAVQSEDVKTADTCLLYTSDAADD